MGIYIYGEIAPTKIDTKAWEKTYEDTLKLVKYGQLAECEFKCINGMKKPCEFASKVLGRDINLTLQYDQRYV